MKFVEKKSNISYRTENNLCFENAVDLISKSRR